MAAEVPTMAGTPLTFDILRVADADHAVETANRGPLCSDPHREHPACHGNCRRRPKRDAISTARRWVPTPEAA